MITENGYIETLDEQEAIEYGNYIEITEEILEEVLTTQEEIIAEKEAQLLQMFEELKRLKGDA
jgi:hypothetical protein